MRCPELSEEQEKRLYDVIGTIEAILMDTESIDEFKKRVPMEIAKKFNKVFGKITSALFIAENTSDYYINGIYVSVVIDTNPFIIHFMPTVTLDGADAYIHEIYALCRIK